MVTGTGWDAGAGERGGLCGAISNPGRLQPRGGESHSLRSWGPEMARPSDVRVRAGRRDSNLHLFIALKFLIPSPEP